MYNHRLVIAGIKENIIEICDYLKKTPEDCRQIREKVKQYEQKYQVLAAWLEARKIPAGSVVDSIKKYVDSRRFDLNKLIVKPNLITINGEEFAGEKALDFSEYVHKNYPILIIEREENSQTDDIPVAVGNGIKIYEINNANDAKRLVGQDTTWCIGYKGPNNMWQNYRDMHQSTFFVVFDENPPNPNQRKVAIDYAEDEIQLTDIPNHTGQRLSNIIEFTDKNGNIVSGNDITTYFKYLESKNVDLNITRLNSQTGEEEKIFQNKPLTKEEQIQNAVFSRGDRLYNYGLDLNTVQLWQSRKSKVRLSETKLSLADLKNPVKISERIELYLFDNPDAIYYTSRYMALGKNVQDEVVEYLMKTIGGKDILQKYVNSGITLPRSQFEIIKDDNSLKLSYLRTRLKSHELLWDEYIKNERQEELAQSIDRNGLSIEELNEAFDLYNNGKIEDLVENYLTTYLDEIYTISKDNLNKLLELGNDKLLKIALKGKKNYGLGELLYPYEEYLKYYLRTRDNFTFNADFETLIRYYLEGKDNENILSNHLDKHLEDPYKNDFNFSIVIRNEPILNLYLNKKIRYCLDTCNPFKCMIHPEELEYLFRDLKSGTNKYPELRQLLNSNCFRMNLYSINNLQSYRHLFETPEFKYDKVRELEKYLKNPVDSQIVPFSIDPATQILNQPIDILTPEVYAHYLRKIEKLRPGFIDYIANHGYLMHMELARGVAMVREEMISSDVTDYPVLEIDDDETTIAKCTRYLKLATIFDKFGYYKKADQYHKKLQNRLHKNK